MKRGCIRLSTVKPRLSPAVVRFFVSVSYIRNQNIFWIYIVEIAYGKFTFTSKTEVIVKRYLEPSNQKGLQKLKQHLKKLTKTKLGASKQLTTIYKLTEIIVGFKILEF